MKGDAVTAIHQALKDLPESFREPFERYYVSLSKGFGKPKGKNKGKPSERTGLIREQETGSREQGAESRQTEEEKAVLRTSNALNDNTITAPDVDSKLVEIAHTVIGRNGKNASPQDLVDFLLHDCRAHGLVVDRSTALMALSKAHDVCHHTSSTEGSVR